MALEEGAKKGKEVIELTKFLPDVKVTTIVWATKDMSKHSQWEAAQGDDLKNQRSTIELNLPKLAKRGNAEEIAKGMVESWLSIYIVFATRQNLINRGIRGAVSGDAEEILYYANFMAIMVSPQLKQAYADLAMDEILAGEWFTDQSFTNLSDTIKSLLSRWRGVSGELDRLKDKCYLCGKQLLAPGATSRESLEFTVETPFAKVKPSPFIDTIVWICVNCVELANQMGLDAKPFEIKTKEVK